MCEHANSTGHVAYPEMLACWLFATSRLRGDMPIRCKYLHSSMFSDNIGTHTYNGNLKFWIKIVHEICGTVGHDLFVPPFFLTGGKQRDARHWSACCASRSKSAVSHHPCHVGHRMIRALCMFGVSRCLRVFFKTYRGRLVGTDSFLISFENSV
jgi:hypothetical protein